MIEPSLRVACWSLSVVCLVAGCHATGLSGPGGSGGSGGNSGQAGSPGDPGGPATAACHPAQRSTPTFHRPMATTSCKLQPVAVCTSPGATDCAKDSDCTNGLAGRCTQQTGAGCSCLYVACQSDSDCGSDHVCDCDPPGSRAITPNCSPAKCRVDSDCGANGYCSPSFSPYDGGGCPIFTGWFCHSAADDCGNDDDCRGCFDGGYASCRYAPELGHWACAPAVICSG